MADDNPPHRAGRMRPPRHRPRGPNMAGPWGHWGRSDAEPPLIAARWSQACANEGNKSVVSALGVLGAQWDPVPGWR